MMEDNNSYITRIVDILCPEVSLSDISNIRKRVYEAELSFRQVEGQPAGKKVDDEEEKDAPIAARGYWHTTAHNDIEKVRLSNSLMIE